MSYIAKKGEVYTLLPSISEDSWEKYEQIYPLDRIHRSIDKSQNLSSMYKLAESEGKWLRDYDSKGKEREEALRTHLGTDRTFNRSHWDKTLYFFSIDRETDLDFYVIHDSELEEKTRMVLDEYFEFREAEIDIAWLEEVLDEKEIEQVKPFYSNDKGILEQYYRLDKSIKETIVSAYMKEEDLIEVITNQWDYGYGKEGEFHIILSKNAKKNLLRIQVG